MRLSLLLNREPFGDILTATLNSYWRNRLQRDFRIRWFPKNPGQRAMNRLGFEGWYGNIYLNFFARSDTPSHCFEPLFLEYKTSRSLWQRYLQRCYVSLALNKHWLPHLAQVAFGAIPKIEESRDCVVVGGNHRLRLLYAEHSKCHVILKEGADRKFIDDEIELRSTLPLSFAPKLLDVTQRSFVEEYIPGIPINRLSNEKQKNYEIDAAEQIIDELCLPSANEIDADLYTERVLVETKTIVCQMALSEGMKSMADTLLEYIQKICHKRLRGQQIKVSWTHGDYQPSNILLARNKIIVIDWETADHRLFFFDIITLLIKQRQNGRSLERVKMLCEDENHIANQIIRKRLGKQWAPSFRKIALSVYVLEELLYICRENKNRNGFSLVIQGLLEKVAELIREI